MRKHVLLCTRFLLVFAAAAQIALAQDTSALRPPKGSKLALIVFEDLQCPDCARAHPLLHKASQTYKIPLVVHDFPLPQHPWSFQGAVLARYFEKQSPELGEKFRGYVFQSQQQITRQNLRSYAERFAQENKVDLPFVVDPQGQIAAAIRADKAIGERVGISHTPTIYVVTNAKTAKPFVEVVDRTQLYQLIDQMKAETE